MRRARYPYDFCEIKPNFLNSLPNDEMIDWSEFKVFADDNLNVAGKATLVFGRRVENIARKGENAGYQHFLLFTEMFSKGCFLRVITSRVNVLKMDKYQSTVISRLDGSQ